MRLIAMEIFQFCGDYSIVLKVHWIPRSEIDRADYISRIIDVDDWKMPAACFASGYSIDKRYSLISIDKRLTYSSS